HLKLIAQRTRHHQTIRLLSGRINFLFAATNAHFQSYNGPQNTPRKDDIVRTHQYYLAEAQQRLEYLDELYAGM
ncbi:hypothetical protein F443_23151, partial [Phytophthora nicotianae P1569]